MPKAVFGPTEPKITARTRSVSRHTIPASITNPDLCQKKDTSTTIRSAPIEIEIYSHMYGIHRKRGHGLVMRKLRTSI